MAKSKRKNTAKRNYSKKQTGVFSRFGAFFGRSNKNKLLVIFVLLFAAFGAYQLYNVWAASYSASAYSPRGGSYWSSTKTSSRPCGPYNDDGRTTYTAKTASGACPQAGVTIAVDPSVIRHGTKVCIKGLGTRIAQDSGSAIKGNRIDIFFNNTSEAINWGRRNVSLTIGACSSTPTPNPPPASGTNTIRIRKTDPRGIYSLRLSVSFKINGQTHYDWENVSNFNNTRNLIIDARNMRWDGSKWVGDMLKTQSTVGGSTIYIRKVDPRTITDLVIAARFYINEAYHYDYYRYGDWTSARNLQLDARGGSYDSKDRRWEGDFLRRE